MSPAVAEPRVRDAALVLAALPPELTAAVLARLSAADAAAVTGAAAEARNGAAEDRARALAAFAATLRGGAAAAPASAPGTVPQLAFLTPAGVARALPFLRDEHPQALALCLAGLGEQDPAAAARLLLGLPPDRQVETLRRLGALGAVHPAAATAAVESLRRRVGEAPPAPPTGGGAAAVARILRAAGQAAPTLRVALRAVDPGLVKALESPDVVAERPLAELLREAGPGRTAAAARRLPVPVLARACRALPTESADALTAALPAAYRELIETQVRALGPVRVREAEESLAALRAALVPGEAA